MRTLITNIDSLVTVNANGKEFKAGKEMNEIGEIKNGAILFNDKIIWVGSAEDVGRLTEEGKLIYDQKINCSGKTILPGFVDSHTHIVFGGNRAEEFGKRLRGATYQEIANSGGGIQTTVAGTREATMLQLFENGMSLANKALRYGTTSLEVKSGYGLTTNSELKMLQSIKKLKHFANQRIFATFLGAHDFPVGFKNNHKPYIDLLINEMLPLVAEERLAEFCDVFIDTGYYSLNEGRQILEAALDYGFKLKVHCDELSDTNSSAMAARLGAISVDHLLCINDEGINAIVQSGTVATLLPGTAYFIRMPYAPARKLIDSGSIVAISTDCNPGSSFTPNMQLILSLSVINMGMTAEEAISAATINGAYAIDKGNFLGSIEIGKAADFIIAGCSSYIDLFYHFGVNHVKEVWIEGRRVFENDDKIYNYRH